MKRCVVLRYREDPWYLETQREAVKRLYICPVLVAGYPDRRDEDIDIMLSYPPGESNRWPNVLFDTARLIVEMFPEGTLFLEGDMIPNRAMELVPTIRHYHTQPWPGILYTGAAQIPTGDDWNLESIVEVTKEFRGLPHVRTEENFDVIGENGEFLHPQAGCRGWRNTEKLVRFRKFVETRKQKNESNR
jgi:hypothetical protein